MTYETRVTRLTVVPQGEPIYGELATHVEIVDEAAGEFVEISKTTLVGREVVGIDPVEWPALRDAIQKMISECRSKEQSP